ncbi:alpha/beta hydrolase family protein [Dokdonella immobilis]|uniref:Predicted dienelactone hydrolase n=1 Tax=Dokdonella immobilis TaxID=578942 RepID=A0A1I4YUW5_9GAMM|nr:hypothetical protein [Dokdonella immobilis]SFN41811.1 Predicted dienelactone hydrolase [Dokdonella immobilis]
MPSSRFSSTRLPIRRTRLRTALMALALAAALPAVVSPAWIHARSTQSPVARHERPTPAHEVGRFKVTDLEWFDAGRQRRVPARLFWPAAAQAGKVPLVVFSPGIGSSRDGYTYLGRYWAEHGVASLHLQHVGSDRSLWRGSVFGLIDRLRSAASESEAIARVEDARFALDRLLDSRLGVSIARQQIAAAGHSFGANTTLLEAGATVTRHGRTLNFRDPRISAAILISAPPFYGDADLGPILASVTIPTLHITTEEDIIRIPGFGSDLTDRQKVFDATASRFKVLAIYREGSHNVFTDRRHFDSAEVAEAVKSATQELTLDFLESVNGKPRALATWADPRRVQVAKFVVQR